MSDANPQPPRDAGAAAPGGAAGAGTAGPHEPAGPAPLGVRRVPTGHPPVDAALERLGDADHLPAGGHLTVYEDVHRGLRDALSALDAHPQPAPSYDIRS
ncbi:hypothetical protein ACLGI4_23255 [Streptomyces sp. HMX112]|uniref:hypothetical protein n=1 Tax=Streptomyces sp. HMX112 TaxID=3390850 RepID=UPI003A7F7C6C